MPTEDDLLKDAIAGTENEIFNEATGKSAPSDEGGPGNRDVEEMGEGLEGQLEADSDKVDGDEGADAGEGEGAEGEDGETGGDKPRDPETGQFVAKKDEGEAPAAKAEDDKPVDPKARVPLSELLSERKARQASEKALADERTAWEAERTTTKSEFEKLNSRIDAFLAAPRAAPAAGQQPNTEADATGEPDIFQDTPGFVENLTTKIERKFEARFVEADMARAHEQHGEKFEKAYAAITSLDKTNPADRAQVQSIWKSPTPGKALMDWYGRQETLRVVGADPTAYAEKVRTEERERLAKDPEFRKSVFEELKAAAGGKGPAAPAGERPRAVFRAPPSLNGAAGGQSGGPAAPSGDNSERGVFEDAFRN